MMALVLYEFECHHCKTRVARAYPAANAPALGKSIGVCACGGSLRRVLSLPVVNAEYQKQRNQYPYVERKFGRLKGCEQTTAEGQSVILSPAHEREVMAMNGLTRL